MKCQFRGTFADREKERLEQAAMRYERTQRPSSDASTWAFVHFTTPYKGSLYWGVRAENGYMVKARTARGLAEAVDAAREEHIRRRSQAVRRASRTASQSLQSSSVSAGK